MTPMRWRGTLLKVKAAIHASTDSGCGGKLMGGITYVYSHIILTETLNLKNVVAADIFVTSS